MGRRQGWRNLRDAAIASGVSLLFAGGAAYAVFQVLGSYHDALVQVGVDLLEEHIDVPVARTRVEVGVVVTAADLEIRSLPAVYVPPEAILAVSAVVGRTAVEPLLPHEPVRTERLAPLEAGQGLQAIIPTGLRAVSLDLTDADQVSGFIQPSDWVDLLVTLPDADDVDRFSETVTLVQGARVLAVNVTQEELDGRARGFRRQHVTLAVTPETVEKVAQALQVGQPRLTLRSVVDMTHVETHGARVAHLLGTTDARSVTIPFREWPEASPPDREVQMIRGSLTTP